MGDEAAGVQARMCDRSPEKLRGVAIEARQTSNTLLSRSPGDDEATKIFPRRAQSDFGVAMHNAVITHFSLDFTMCRLYTIKQLRQKIVARFHEKWKGRIEPWQPKRKQRRKAAKSTRHLQ
jgi:hypothetical protein